jgi:HK97 family phage portal protein
MSNGGRLAGILTNKMPVDPEKQKKFREDWITNYGGAGNSGKTAILTGDWSWQTISQSLADSQAHEQRRMQVEEICRVFRVMPLMIGFTDKTATYASVEQMLLAHIVHTMSPWYERLEQSADRQLLSAADRRAGLYTKFGVNALLRGAMADRVAYYTGMYNIGALNPNEIRDLEDMNPYPAGGKYRVPLNMKDADAPDPVKAATSQAEQNPA